MHPQPRPDPRSRPGPPPADRSGPAVLDEQAGQPALVRSVAKAARILRCFDSSAALTVRDIARRTGLPRSTCHAICSTLVAENMLELRPRGGYVPGVELVTMGGQVVERSGLVGAAAPSMNALAASTGGEIHLGRLDEGWIVYLDRVGSPHRLDADDGVGLRVPAHMTGCGKAALAELDARLARETALSAGIDPDTLDRLTAELRAAKARGFVVATSFRAGLASVAAGVTGRDGRVVGGLSVADRRETFSPRRIATLGTAVRDAADSISRQLARHRAGPPAGPAAAAARATPG